MAINQTDEEKSPDIEATNENKAAFTAQRAQSKFGLGVGLTFVATLLILASFVLVWFGVFPGLIALLIAIPLAVAGVRLVRQGQPATMTHR